ncbi:hypothetical protein LTR95_008841 [Oleoguttula sp. CCFEE 5521]
MLLSALALPFALARNQQPLYSIYTFNSLEHLAGIAPYFEPADPPRDPSPPHGCKVMKAAYLVRHAAINANDFDYESYLEPFTQKLETRAKNGAIPQTSHSWPPVQLSYRYPDLRLPSTVWASSAERTVASAKGFIRGIELEDNTINLTTVYEGKEAGANSLTPYSSCPAYHGSMSSEQSQAYVKVFTAPILARFQSYAPNFDWTSSDVIGMFEYCGYETVIRGSLPFCSGDLFTPDERLRFEYSQDIMYYQNVGYGHQESTGAVGSPWVNATVNLLSSESSEEDMYVLFTHRELPPMVLVPLGLFNNSALTGANLPNATMPLDRVNHHRTWISSYILPFLTNIAIEKMNCSASYSFEIATDPMYYRVLVNRSPQTLPSCYDGPAESCSAKGMETFLQGRTEVVGEYSERCGVDYSNSTDVLSIYTANDMGEAVGRWSKLEIGQNESRRNAQQPGQPSVLPLISAYT